MADEINGKRVAVLEVEVRELISDVRDLIQAQRRFFEAGGPCETARERTIINQEQIKVVWWVLGISIPPMFGMLIKLAFFK